MRMSGSHGTRQGHRRYHKVGKYRGGARAAKVGRIRLKARKEATNGLYYKGDMSIHAQGTDPRVDLGA